MKSSNFEILWDTIKGVAMFGIITFTSMYVSYIALNVSEPTNSQLARCILGVMIILGLGIYTLKKSDDE